MSPILLHLRDILTDPDEDRDCPEACRFYVDANLVFNAEGDGVDSAAVLAVRSAFTGRPYVFDSGEEERVLARLVEREETRAVVDAELERRETKRAADVVAKTFVEFTKLEVA